MSFIDNVDELNYLRWQTRFKVTFSIKFMTNSLKCDSDR